MKRSHQRKYSIVSADEAKRLANICGKLIRERVEDTGPDRVVAVLEIVKAKLDSRNGDRVRLPILPKEVNDGVSRDLLEELLAIPDKPQRTDSFYERSLTKDWNCILGSLLSTTAKSKDAEDVADEPDGKVEGSPEDVMEDLTVTTNFPLSGDSPDYNSLED